MAKTAGDLSLPANRANYLKQLLQAQIDRRKFSIISRDEVYKGFQPEELKEILPLPDSGPVARTVQTARNRKLINLDTFDDVRKSANEKKTTLIQQHIDERAAKAELEIKSTMPEVMLGDEPKDK